MPEESAYDMAMLFVLEGGGPVRAESAMQVDKQDTLMTDFHPIYGYKYYSNFFEVTSFNFTLTVKPEEDNVGSLSKHGAAKPAAAKPGAAHDSAQHSLFDRWRSATSSEYRNIRFPMSFDTFSFSRVIDGASPIFFQACATQTSFERAVLIKRVSLGQRAGISRLPLAFLRMDFTDVRLKTVTWQDGDLVTENCSFTCSKMKFQYRQQNDDGSLKPVGQQADWDRDRDASAHAGTRRP